MALATTALATFANFAVVQDHAGEVVGFVFLCATYWSCLRANHPLPPDHYGLKLGGLLAAAPLSATQLAKSSALAFLQATGVALLVLPPFWLGFVFWYQPELPWQWSRLASGSLGALLALGNLSLAHLLVVALPEEAFFRGYLQTALRDRYPRAWSVGPIQFSSALVLSSAIFSLGHVTTTFELSRLAVFFPSLLFGLLRNWTKSIGASVVLHAQCNVFAALLGQGYGLY